MTQQAKFNITQAARVARKGRATIQRYIKDGRLSFETDRNGGKYIEAAELIRVFGELQNPDTPAGAAHDESKAHHETPDTVVILRQRNKDLEERIDELKQDREERKEREAKLQAEKDKLVGIIEKQTLLLPAPEKTEGKKKSKSPKPKSVIDGEVISEGEDIESQRNVAPKAAPTAVEARKKKKEPIPKKKGFWGGIFGGK